MEKGEYAVEPKEAFGNEPPVYNDPHSADIVENKGIRMGEAADMYGDLETAEDYGYVSRGYVMCILRCLIRKGGLSIIKLEIPPHSIHCPWWNDRYWPVLGNWPSLDTGWTSQYLTGLHFYWYSNLCNGTAIRSISYRV